MCGKVYGKRLSAHIMLQPKLAAAFFGQDDLDDLGFFARALIIGTGPYMPKTYVERDLLNEPAIQEFNKRLRLCAQGVPILRTGSRNELAPPTVLLSSGAKALYIQFHDDVQPELGANGKYAEIRALAAKAHDHAARLAATLFLFHHLSKALENPDLAGPGTLPPVPEDYMKRGILLARYYLDEALRLKREHAVPIKERDAQELYD